MTIYGLDIVCPGRTLPRCHWNDSGAKPFVGKALRVGHVNGTTEKNVSS